MIVQGLGPAIHFCGSEDVHVGVLRSFVTLDEEGVFGMTLCGKKGNLHVMEFPPDVPTKITCEGCRDMVDEIGRAALERKGAGA